jgi:outer membrane usher protein
MGGAASILAGCTIGVGALVANGGARGNIVTIDLGGAYATAATAKADKLPDAASMNGGAGSSEAVPHPSSPPPAAPMRVETVMGTPYVPPATTMPADNVAGEKTAKLPALHPATDAAPMTVPAPDSAGRAPGHTPSQAATPAPQNDAAPGEIMWSNKTAALTPAATDAAPPINPSGRVIEMAVPMRDGQFYLGDIGARISPTDEISVAKDRLAQIAAPLLRGESLDVLKAMPDSEGYLPLPALKEKGFDIQFDRAKVEMQFAPNLEQRATGRLSAGGRREQVRSENLAAPAIFAGYLNMRMGADYSSRPFHDEEGAASARIGFDGALRWSDVVFESAATFDMEDGFTRGASRFVYDLPESALRFSAGDVSPLKSDLQGGSDLLGIAIEKSYQKLQPAANIRPTGSRSFRIERPSKVDVTVNGHVVQRLHLRPGDYDLSDLPLSAGANDITLVIEDDVGQKRTLDFTVFSGRSLLAPGISEWALSAGVASRYGGGKAPGLHNGYSGLDYDFAAPVVSGFYERGLTADLTGNVHLQADPDTLMGGAGAAFQTSFGFWGLDGAISQSGEHGLGYAAGLGYDLANIEGADGVARSFRLAADYKSERFAAVDMLDPFNETMLDISAIYSQALPWNMAGSVSGSYSVGRGGHADRYGVDVSLWRGFGPSLSAGLSAGYEQALGPVHEGEAEDGFSAAIRLSYRVDEKSSIDAGHDLAGGRSNLSYRRQEGTGVGSWNAQVELDRTGAISDRGRTGDYGVNGSLATITNRAEISVSQHSGLAGLDTDTLDQRTSVTAGTAIAFADGRVAVGRPVSNGFAIVGAHDNLPDSDVIIGASRDAQQGGSDFLGPALVSQMSPYSPARVAYDVDNLPVGYDLGAGAFDLHPAYKSGYRLTVGSDYTVTAFGALADEKGEPIALLTGVAQEEGGKDGHKVTVFTNRTGRFGAQGLRPGRWVLEMATEPKTRFVIDIPKDAVGLVKLDTLKPAGTAQ